MSDAERFANHPRGECPRCEATLDGVAADLEELTTAMQLAHHPSRLHVMRVAKAAASMVQRFTALEYKT